jgi:hypothetical protein
MVVVLMGNGRRERTCGCKEPQAYEHSLKPAQSADGREEHRGKPRNVSTASRATRLRPVARSSDAGGSWRSLEAVRIDPGPELAYRYESRGR